MGNQKERKFFRPGSPVLKNLIANDLLAK